MKKLSILLLAASLFACSVHASPLNDDHSPTVQNVVFKKTFETSVEIKVMQFELVSYQLPVADHPGELPKTVIVVPEILATNVIALAHQKKFELFKPDKNIRTPYFRKTYNDQVATYRWKDFHRRSC